MNDITTAKVTYLSTSGMFEATETFEGTYGEFGEKLGSELKQLAEVEDFWNQSETSDYFAVDPTYFKIHIVRHFEVNSNEPFSQIRAVIRYNGWNSDVAYSRDGDLVENYIAAFEAANGIRVDDYPTVGSFPSLGSVAGLRDYLTFRVNA